MAAIFNWNIIKCVNKTIGENDNVIHNIQYELVGTEGTKAESIKGSEELDVSDLSNFTAWSSVTESQVVGWLESSIGSVALQSMKNLIQQRLDATTSDNPF